MNFSLSDLLKYALALQGVSWEHIPSDQPLIGISCGPCGQVWAVGKNGSSCWRLGISAAKPTGTNFLNEISTAHVPTIL